jgi:major outer membrane protein
MKKTLALLAGLVASATAYALPVLNPGIPAIQPESVFLCDDGCGPRCWSLRFGYRGDFIYNAKLEDSTHTIDNYGVYTNAGTLTLNLWNRLDIYGVAGASSQDFESKYANGLTVGATPIAYVKANYDTRPSWGVGAHLLLWKKQWRYAGLSYFGFGFEYFTTRIANARSILLDKRAALVGQSGTARYRATQFTLSYGQRIKRLIPYVAIKWSNQRVSLTGTPSNGVTTGDALATFLNLKGQRNFGWAVGTTLVDFMRMNITGEARFVDEKAATVTAEFRF